MTLDRVGVPSSHFTQPGIAGAQLLTISKRVIPKSVSTVLPDEAGLKQRDLDPILRLLISIRSAGICT